MWFQNENVVRLSYIPKQDMSGCWFQTFIVFSISYMGMSSSQLTKSYFSNSYCTTNQMFFHRFRLRLEKTLRKASPWNSILIFSRQNGHHKKHHINYPKRLPFANWKSTIFSWENQLFRLAHFQQLTLYVYQRVIVGI